MQPLEYVCAVGRFFPIFVDIFLPPNLIQMEIYRMIKSQSCIYHAENKKHVFPSAYDPKSSLPERRAPQNFEQPVSPENFS